MNKQQATKLANTLASEADEEGIPRAYLLREAANRHVWSVLELDTATWATAPVQLWVSPELSFSLTETV